MASLNVVNNLASVVILELSFESTPQKTEHRLALQSEMAAHYLLFSAAIVKEGKYVYWNI